ncbi:hypothetical protein BG842_00335 [Haladaptatus sp. W1]|uniref:hypothetical protein n=1 Tax=Haladaptatus sp. W1 TaxID=1897478 RepID=UPI0008498F30|nr:hypothetical protein [Haladaptatus sp. W1]ODR81222.1 hypothetical protein BG842_00335 [Haladaptatus sp. W1]
MSTELPRTIDRFRQPEYTGENRCTPCTIVNVAIAVVVSTILTFPAMPLGIAFFAFSMAAIYLRGYLVPGTPWFTKTYFPDWLLRKFDKHEMPTATPEPTDREPEDVLSEANVVEPCAEIDDLCLDEEFRSAWHENMERVMADGAEKRDLSRILGADESELEFEEHDSAFIARIEGRRLGQWESRPALIADLAAARELSDRYDHWDDLSVDNQSRILSGLRIFLDTCPECGDNITAEQETVESCCRSMEVVAATCEGCDARILEVEQTE